MCASFSFRSFSHTGEKKWLEGSCGSSGDVARTDDVVDEEFLDAGALGITEAATELGFEDVDRIDCGRLVGCFKGTGRFVKDAEFVKSEENADTSRLGISKATVVSDDHCPDGGHLDFASVLPVSVTLRDEEGEFRERGFDCR